MSNQLLSTIITQVRSDLQDPDPPAIDWTAAEMLDYWNRYILFLFHERPDSRLDYDQSVIEYVPATDPTQEVIVHDRWLDAGRDEMKSHAYAKDGAAKRNMKLSGHFHAESLAKLRGT